MSRRTLYLTQTYVRRGRYLSPGSAMGFDSAVEAEDAGRGLSRSVDGVLVFAVDGDPDYDVWEEPILFAKYGDTPPFEF